MTTVTQAALDAGFSAARASIDKSGYGNWVKDDLVRYLVSEVLFAAAPHMETRKESKNAK